MKIYQLVKENNKKIDELNIKTNIILRSALTGVLFGAVIMLIPILICINLFLVYILVPLLVFLIALFLIMFCSLSIFFYYQALKAYDDRVSEINTKYNVFFDSSIIGIILLIVMIIAYIVLFSLHVI